jgi:hypothetical protein
MKLNFKNDVVRRMLSIGGAFVVACVVEYFFSMSHDYLIPIAAIFVMLTPIGNLVYQGVMRFFLLVVIIVLLSLILPPHQMLYTRVYDASLGAVIGIASNLFVFPRQVDSEFRAAVLPMLKAYKAYFAAIIDSVFEKDEATLEASKVMVEVQLQAFPDWVYAKGFDLGLKKGHQYFLMKLHQIAEILFAMQHAARCRYDEEVRTIMRQPMMVCADKIKYFFDALITVFELQKLKEGVEDFEDELHNLDVKFQELIPSGGDLLDMTHDDVLFYEIIYTLNDLRRALIRLGQALR